MNAKIAICTPIRDGLAVEYVSTLLALQKMLHSKGIDWEWLRYERLPSISDGRNALAAQVMAGTFTHAFWLDSDVGLPDAAVLLRMLALDVDVACAAYLFRPHARGVDVVVRQRYSVAVEDLVQEPERGAIRVAWSGMGCVLMRRAVLARVATHAEVSGRRYAHALTSVAPMFEDTVHEGAREFEDVTFFRRWRDLGGETWALVDADTVHDGRRGNLRDLWASRADLHAIRERSREIMAAMRVELDLLRSTIARVEALGHAAPEASALVAHHDGHMPRPDSRRPIFSNMHGELVADLAKHMLFRSIPEVRAERQRLEGVIGSASPAASPTPMLAAPSPSSTCPCGVGAAFSECHGAPS